MAAKFPTCVGVLTATLIFAWGLLIASAQEALAPIPITFTANLSGDQLVTPVDSSGSGEVRALLIGNELVVTGTYQELGFTMGANIRKAVPGENGSVVRLTAEQATLGTSRNITLDTDGGTSGWFTGVFTLSDDQVEELKQGFYYVHLYTEENPTGELRGQLGTDVVLNATAEDLVGIWRAVDNGDTWQNKEDGTWSYLSTLAEVGEASAWTWQLDGDIATWDLLSGQCEGRYVHREVLYQDGRRRWLTLEAGPCGTVGTWRELVKIDEEGDRIPLR